MKIKVIVGSVLLATSLVALADTVVGEANGSSQTAACSQAQKNAQNQTSVTKEIVNMGQCSCEKDNLQIWRCTVTAMTRDKK